MLEGTMYICNQLTGFKFSIALLKYFKKDQNTKNLPVPQKATIGNEINKLIQTNILMQ